MPINRPAVRLSGARAGAGDPQQQQQQQQQAASVGRRQSGGSQASAGAAPANRVVVNQGAGPRPGEVGVHSPGPSPAGSLNNLAMNRGPGLRVVLNNGGVGGTMVRKTALFLQGPVYPGFRVEPANDTLI
ncbi:hypothetical protein PoB_000878200 [Plakobranchus ocellatus]|uniref:Uncharacterized protein n=1 Tax=Plakobranchus ocellatus TaxID=259542 RepID=A0AAV3YHF0_9GAST|nr:hypothetical protein PoB_000878200 [Plakobranchus ocellatus]